MGCLAFLLFRTAALLDPQLRFISLPNDRQAIKCYEQLEHSFDLVRRNFNVPPSDTISRSTYYDVFMIRKGKDAASYLEVTVEDTCEYDEANTPRPIKFITLYSLTVHESYRKMGLAQSIVTKAVADLAIRHGLNGDSILALHLSPRDEYMYVSAKFYYKLGFRRAMFLEKGPFEYRSRINALMGNSRDLFELIDDLEARKDNKYYVMLHTRLRDFGKEYVLPADSLLKTERLAGFCKGRMEQCEKEKVQPE